LSDFSLRVVRADDLLVLTFDFFNLRLDASTPGVPRLVRVSPTQAARIVVHFQPQHVTEEAFDENLGPPATSERIGSFMAGVSRLAFRVPDGIAAIPLTMEGLLDWRALEPVPPNRPDPPREPALDETAIEMPCRVLLAPTDAGLWVHRTPLFAPGGRAELWHTSYTDALAALLDDVRDERAEIRVTAVWSPDLQSGGGDAAIDPFPMSLSPADRIRIVQQSANPTLFADVLRLSALGGWLRVRGTSWNHDLAMGRDQKVRTEERGVLYPFGHEVTLVKTSERRFATSNTGVRAAYLMQKAVLYVREPVQTYSDPAMPFKRMRISQTVIPIDVGPSSGPFVPTVGRVPFGFPVTALDQVDTVHQFSARMVYVPDGFTDLATIRSRYVGHETVDLSSRLVGFAPTQGSLADAERLDASQVPGPTELRTRAMSFGEAVNSSSARPFPIMTTASVAVPAAEQLFGAVAPPVTIKLNKDYVDGGFVGSHDGVFADIPDGLRLDMQADRAGGVAAPKLEMTALSATHGAFPDVKSLRAEGKAPEDILEQCFDGELLGVIRLREIIELSGGTGDLPQVKPIAGARRGVSFHWEPALKSSLPKPLKPSEGQKLILDGTLSRSSSLVIGSLQNVGLEFFGLLQVDFNHVTFRMQTGESPKFEVSLKDFKFTGELEFVNKLQKWVKDAFGDSGPSVNVTPQGVSAGFAMTIPTIPLGTIILQNLALSAALNLSFGDEPASVRFGLSSRKDPFVVTYTVFGGGGYFSFTVDTSGGVSLEAGLGFGGAADIDLFIAKGVVQAMVFIEFKLVGKRASLTGYVRIYGCVEVLSLVAVSVEFYMGLTYDLGTQEAIGEASLTVMVRVLAFSKSVRLHVKRRFSTNGTPGIAAGADDVLTFADWGEYCRSFAVA
jgi:hypothetical protein